MSINLQCYLFCSWPSSWASPWTSPWYGPSRDPPPTRGERPPPHAPTIPPTWWPSPTPSSTHEQPPTPRYLSQWHAPSSWCGPSPNAPAPGYGSSPARDDGPWPYGRTPASTDGRSSIAGSSTPRHFPSWTPRPHWTPRSSGTPATDRGGVLSWTRESSQRRSYDA